MTTKAECGINDSLGCPADQRKKWGFEHRLRLDVIISFITLLLTGVGYLIYHAKWETHVDEALVTLEKADSRNETNSKNQGDKLDKRLERIEDKLDQVIRRGK